MHANTAIFLTLSMFNLISETEAIRVDFQRMGI